MNEMHGILKVKRVPAQAMKVLGAAGIGRIVVIERMELVHES